MCHVIVSQESDRDWKVSERPRSRQYVLGRVRRLFVSRVDALFVCLKEPHIEQLVYLFTPTTLLNVVIFWRREYDRRRIRAMSKKKKSIMSAVFNILVQNK